MLVDKRVKLWGFEEEKEVKIEKLNDYTTYMIEVTYDKNSFIHRAIMCTDEYNEDKETMPVKIFCNDYEDVVFTEVKKVHYLKVIAELSMDVDTSVVYQEQEPAVKHGTATVEEFNETQGPEITTDETPSLEVTVEDETPSAIVATEEVIEEAPVVVTEEQESAPEVYCEEDQGLPLLEL